ncbi:hypothetical protein ACFL23_04470, partial [Patescibacteria group bacterium]
IDTHSAEAVKKATVLFEDEFTDNRNNWTESDNEEYLLEITNGKYIFVYKKKNSIVITTRTINIDQDKDFQIQSTFLKTAKNVFGSFGMVWGYKDDYNYYGLVISGGSYSYFKNENDTLISISNWTESDYINKHNSTNKIAIKKTDNKLELFINDHFVYESTSEKFFSNEIGFLFWHNKRIEIDNIVVTQYDEKIKTPIVSQSSIPYGISGGSQIVGNSLRRSYGLGSAWFDEHGNIYSISFSSGDPIGNSLSRIFDNFWSGGFANIYTISSAILVVSSTATPIKPPVISSSTSSSSTKLGDYDYCKDNGPCGHGEGDCDPESNECEAGCTCENDVGAEYGFEAGVDVCVAPSSKKGDYDYCKKYGPCGAGEGDCDSDSECKARYICKNDVGAKYGFASDVDVCVN